MAIFEHAAAVTFRTHNSKTMHEMNKRGGPDVIETSEVTLTSFIDDTTLHGLKGACDVQYSKLRRAFWCIILLFMSGVFVTSSSLTIRDYLRYVHPEYTWSLVPAGGMKP